MTGLQTYLCNNGWVKTRGNGNYNTYTNVSNTYKKDNKIIIIGLIRIGENNTIVITHPIVDFLPTSDYDEYLDKYFKGEFNRSVDEYGNVVFSSLSFKMEEALNKKL